MTGRVRHSSHRLLRATSFRRSHARSGAVLPLALLVVALMALAARAFVDLMSVEAVAVTRGVERRQLRLAAESGIEYLAAMLDARKTSSMALKENDPNIGSLGQSSPDIRFEFGRTSSVRSDRKDGFPAVDESSKLNLLTLSLKANQRTASRTRLMALPGMEESIAEAILDWMDADDTPSSLGAESAWYASQKNRVLPAQRPLETLDELLLVRGVTPELLYGPLVDSTTDRVSKSERADSASRGWAHLLTLWSGESNLRVDGGTRIHLNQPDLVQLFDQLETAFGEEAARFVVAYRLNGDLEGSDPLRTSDAPASDSKAEAGPLDDKLEAARLRAAEQQAEPGEESTENPRPQDKEERRGGLDLGRRAAYSIRSVWDLIGSKVRIDVDGRDSVLESPWKSDLGVVAQTESMLEETVSPVAGDRLVGRVRLDTATPFVLNSIPGMSPELVERIVIARSRQRGRLDGISPAWLLTEGLCDLQRLREVAPYLTRRGQVWSGVVRGVTTESTARVVALEFILDGTQTPSRLVELRDVNLFESPRRRAAVVERDIVGDDELDGFAGGTMR
jgi:hypothetical protein